MNIKALNGRICVVAHDAGAANLIIGWLRKISASEVRTSLAGPAADLWENAFGSTKLWSLSTALRGADILLSGTSYNSNLEHQARILARNLGVHSVGVIDHWVNYSQRFTRDKLQVLPDEIWVTDPDAVKIASSHFPRTPIKLKSNDYLSDLVERISTMRPKGSPKSLTALYVLEPIRNWGSPDNPGEFQALDYFLENFQLAGIPSDCEILLRPHPSEDTKKYHQWLKPRASLNVRLDTSQTLEDAISKSDIVIGCETYALIVAAATGKRVICSLPPYAPKCRLPSKELLHLRDIKPYTNKAR